MLDFRKVKDLRKVVVAVNTKPNDTKEQDYHLALAEYLHKELKSNGLSVTRNNVTLKVSLKNKYKDRYEHVIIDCLDGKTYLRGKEAKDKYFGKLRRFEGGQRTSDAYHCLVQSATRLINRIKKLEQQLDGEERVVLGDDESMEKEAITDYRKGVEKTSATPTPQDVSNAAEIAKPIIDELKEVAPQLNIDTQTVNEVSKQLTDTIQQVQSNPNAVQDALHKAQPSVQQIHDLVQQVSSQAQSVDPSVWQQLGITKAQFIAGLQYFNEFANLVTTVVSSHQEEKTCTASIKDYRKEKIEDLRKEKVQDLRKEKTEDGRTLIAVAYVDLRKKHKIDYLREVQDFRKNIIAQNAYEWVKERAEHILDENKGMPAGEAYGIAWKQYKKDHPSWKSKKEKAKEKEKKKKDKKKRKKKGELIAEIRQNYLSKNKI